MRRIPEHAGLNLQRLDSKSKLRASQGTRTTLTAERVWKQKQFWAFALEMRYSRRRLTSGGEDRYNENF